ncbi:MAG: hypothetical protein R2778_04720 [Saprospiraceae bacterium]
MALLTLKAFAKVREVVPDHFLLVPGVGAQGGDLSTICQFGMNKDCGLLVNSSRGIIYASKGNDFAEKAREKVHQGAPNSNGANSASTQSQIMASETFKNEKKIEYICKGASN